MVNGHVYGPLSFALLLPRAGLALALLLAPGVGGAALPANVASANAGEARAGRDGTYFGEDGRLTAFARGVLIANCAWVAWRALVLDTLAAVHTPRSMSLTAFALVDTREAVRPRAENVTRH